MGLFTLAALLWSAVPFWDRGKEASVRLKRINYVGFAMLAAFLGLTALGYLGWP